MTSNRAAQLADRIERGEVVCVGSSLMAQEVRAELDRRGIAYTETLSVHGGIGRVYEDAERQASRPLTWIERHVILQSR